MEVFGSTTRDTSTEKSDVDLLVTFDTVPNASALLEIAGEVEEVIGAPVDFVLRTSLEKSKNRFAREDILASAVCLYGC
jgi:predicted nucleotidyltransferase